MIAEIYERKFTEAGFEVSLADSGDQVLALYKKNRPNIILLDLILPKMNGFQVIEEIRKTDHDTKVIVFSNLNQAEDREKASFLGANGFVSKSDYTPNALVTEIQRQVNQLKEESINRKKTTESEGNEGQRNSIKEKRKILMMEDEEIFRDMFGGKLKDDGYAVEFAEDGATGMKKAMEENYDLFVIDMIMPNITGEEIVAKLKREDKTKDVPIIILSASVDEMVQREVENAGINGFFVKTQLIPSELSRKIGELLRQ